MKDSTQQLMLNAEETLNAASAYAKVASKQNPIYAQLAKKRSKKKAVNAYNVALGDWFHAPEIRHIEWDTGRICVRASDDVMVTKITITILSDEGQCLEQAEAQSQSNRGILWKYQATHTGLVRVEAWDFASNVTRQEFIPSKSYFIWDG